MNTQNKQLSLNLVPERCWCGNEPHPALLNCNICGGSGHVIGGDEYQPCSSCKIAQRVLNAQPSPIERMRAEERSGLEGYHVNHTTKGA